MWGIKLTSVSFFLFNRYFVTMVNKRDKNRFFAVKIIVQKNVPAMYFSFGCKTANPNHFENFASLRQMIIFIHVICVFIGFVIFFKINS